MSIIFDNPLPAIGCGDPGDPIDYSVLFDGNSYMEMTPAAAGDRKIATVSAWLKPTGKLRRHLLSAINPGNDINSTRLYFYTDQKLYGQLLASNNTYAASSVGKFADYATWLHVFWRYNTAINAQELWVGGRQVDYDVLNAIPQDYLAYLGSANRHVIGARWDYIEKSEDYLADFVYLNGIYAEPTDFGRFNAQGFWVPKTYAGKKGGQEAYGLNGFHLDFADPLNLGKDVSPENRVSHSSYLPAVDWVKKDAAVTAANKLVPSASNTTHHISQIDEFIAGKKYVARARVTTEEYQYFSISASVSAFNENGYANFDLTQDGSIISAGATTSNVAIEKVEDGVFICSVEIECIATTGSFIGFMGMPTGIATRFPSFEGNGSDGLYIEKVQVRQSDSNPAFVETGDHAKKRNDFTSVGLTAANQTTDTPTNNITKLNPAFPASGTFSNGNKEWLGPSADQSAFGALVAQSGELYFEGVPNLNGGAVSIGVAPADDIQLERFADSSGAYAYSSSGVLRNNASTSAYGSAYNGANRVGVLLNLLDGTLEFSVDGVSQGVAATGLSGQFLPAISDSSGAISTGWELFFEEEDLLYKPDSASPWGAAALACPEILDPTEGYQRKTLINGAGAAMDWNPLEVDTLVLTGRTDAAYGWRVSMSIDGVQVHPFDTQGTAGDLSTEVGSIGLTFTPTGYTVGGASALQGTRRDRIFRMGPRYGMDLVSFTHVQGTPTFVPHNAGGVAELINFFPVSGGDRRQYHKAVGNNAYIRINASGTTSDPGWITNSANGFTVNGNLPSGTYRAWVIRSVAQYSSVFSYQGTGSATNGAFVPFDFEAETIMGRNTTASSQYFVKDNLGSNPNTDRLRLNNTGENADDWDMDFYSNGVKFFDASADVNAGQIYAGFAIAKTPGKFALAG